MSEQQQPDTKGRKPGFFSRLFTARDVQAPSEPPAEESAAPPEPPPAVAASSAPVQEPEKKGGIFGRWFGKKEQAPADPAPATEAVLPVPQEGVGEVEEMGWFERLRDRLRKGSGSFIASIRSAVGLSGRLDDETVERLEEILIASDVSMDTALKIVEKMRKRARAENIEGRDAIMKLFRETIEELFVGNVKSFEPGNPDGPHVVMVVGVNGVGKTTTIGKMARRCRDAGLDVMLVAGDTFRAAAVEQLEIWSQRNGCQFMKGAPGADPSGLAFDALQQAKARGVDVVFIDTAGRLHTKTGLMDELKKISRVCTKIIPNAPHETLLVIDATTGQNAVKQVQEFSRTVPLTGLVMTKLDGTAKGGILISIRDQFDIPVTLVGVGEGIGDLRDFDPEQFAAALFAEEKVAS